MKRVILFTLALLVLATTTVAISGVDALYRRGADLFRSGDLAGGIQCFTAILEDDPDHMGAQFALAQAYHTRFEQLGLFYGEAVSRYRAVVDTLDDQGDAESPRQMALLLLGKLCLRGGEYRAARQYLERFLALRPEYYAVEEVWNSVGVAHYYLNEYEAAVRAFERALEAEPLHAPARFNLRSVFTRLSLFDVAMANSRAGRLDLALVGLEHLLAMAPRYLPARLQRAIALRKLGRDDEAVAEARTGLTGGGTDAVRFELHELVADILAQGGDVAGAVAEYRKCLRIFPGYVQVVEKLDALETPATDHEGADTAPTPSFDEGRVSPLMQFPM